MTNIVAFVVGAILSGCASTALRLCPPAMHRGIIFRWAARVFRAIDFVVFCGMCMGYCAFLLMMLPRWLVLGMLGPIPARVTVLGILAMLFAILYVAPFALMEMVQGRSKPLHSFTGKASNKPPLWDPELDL
jgi:hypothetical protein